MDSRTDRRTADEYTVGRTVSRNDEAETVSVLRWESTVDFRGKQTKTRSFAVGMASNLHTWMCCNAY